MAKGLKLRWNLVQSQNVRSDSIQAIYLLQRLLCQFLITRPKQEIIINYFPLINEQNSDLFET